MRRGRIIREAADLPLLIIQQPADTFFWRMAINKWSVLIRHQSTAWTVAVQPCFPHPIKATLLL